MAGEDLIYAIPSGLITLFKALGWTIIFYIVFNVINLILNRKKREEMKLACRSIARLDAGMKIAEKLLKLPDDV